MNESSGSSDAVFGMTLDATVTTTNLPVLVAQPMLPNGSFPMIVRGVFGYRCAIDRSFDLVTWTELMTFTNFTGQTQITDPGFPAVAPRFYRCRLVP